jgi:transposase
MIVRKDGMPVLSRVYPGNQSEPETMENMLTDLEKKINHNQVSFDKPTIVMDRGIATKENIDYLVEKKYDYTVIRREDQSVRFRDEFINNRTSFRQIQIHTSSYGESNAVFVKKMPNNGESTCEVLCISEGRARKEEAMDLQRSTRFLEKVAAFNQTIVKNTIKKEEKIEEKKRKLEEKNPAMMKKFALVLLRDAKSTIIGIEAQPIPQNEIPLFGCYVIESTHTEMTDEEIWHLYMQQTHVEAAFEAMKGELGMRPVYHQTESRTSAHLFITVLAYHLLATIEHLLQLQGDHRKWSTIRTELSTHTRSTVSFIDSKNISHQIRLSGKPEAAHQDIYKKPEVKDPTKRREFTLNSAQIEK